MADLCDGGHKALYFLSTKKKKYIYIYIWSDEKLSATKCTIDLGKVAVHGPIWASPCSFIHSSATKGRDYAMKSASDTHIVKYYFSTFNKTVKL
jgi:hypothetical protein